MNWMELVGFTVACLIVTFAAALRDAWSLRRSDITWIEWHFFNWVALYTIPVYIISVKGWYLIWWYWIPVVFVLWLLWKWTYKQGGGHKWTF